MDADEDREGTGVDPELNARRAELRRDPRRASALEEFRRSFGGSEAPGFEQLSQHALLLMRADAAVGVMRGAGTLEWVGAVHCVAPTLVREHESFADLALLNGDPQLFDDTTHFPGRLKDVEALGWRSVASVPIIVSGVTVAAILVGRTGGVPWGQREHEAARQWSTMLALEYARHNATEWTESRSWLEVVQRAAVAMAVVDADGVVVVANAALAEWAGEATLGRGVRLLDRLQMDVVDRATVRDVMLGARRQATAEVSWTHDDGEPRRAHLVLAQARFALDGQIGYLAVLEDVTEVRGAAEALRAREQQLRLSQRREALGQLTGGLAHEFSNTLAAIIGFASLLRDDLEPSDPRRDDVEDILRVSGRATELINRLLDLTPQRVSERATFDLREILRAFSVVAHRVLPTTIEWNLELPETDVQAVVDRAQLEQVLLGLVVNSRDAMPRGGQIQMSLQSQLLDLGDGVRTPMACIRITDTGEGIAADVLPNLWTPFFTTKPMGTGLGLSVGKAILREHGGDLRLESPAGVSATFAVYLPLAARESRPRAGTDPKVLPLRAEPTGVSILLAEDERAVRSTTQRILERAGYRVVAASDGEEAWRLLEQQPEAFQLVVTDLVMPRLSGAELVRRIRGAHPDLPIVVTSAHPSRDWDPREIRAESVSVLKKPFAAATLLETLRTALGGSSSGPGFRS